MTTNPLSRRGKTTAESAGYSATRVVFSYFAVQNQPQVEQI
jgi:hypothetical protein